MSILVRLLCVVMLALWVSQSWGLAVVPQGDNYQYDVALVALNTQSYDYGTVSKLWSDERQRPTESSSARDRSGSFFVLVGDFIATKSIPKLRQQYVDEVAGLKDLGLNARASGASPESVARMLHAERRALDVKYKDLTPKDKLREITERNIKKYNDPLGPSIDFLRSK